MTDETITRRGLLWGASAVVLAASATPAGAQALFGTAPAAGDALQLRGVAVDVSPLLAHGSGATAQQFAAVLLPELRTVFADRLNPGDRGGAILTARITNLFFSDYVERNTSFAFGNNDNIEGDGIVSRGGAIVSSTHILTELPPSYSGAYNLPGIDAARMQAIAYQFAYWLRREMNV